MNRKVVPEKLPGDLPRATKGHSTAWKIVVWTLAIPAALCLLLISTLAVGGWWVERVYLGKEQRFDLENPKGATTVRAFGARFQWIRLNFMADSVWVRSPDLDARTGKTVIGIDWLGGIMALRPAARLDADSVYVRMRTDTTERVRKPLDSLAFPDIAIPLAVRLAVRGVRVDDDSGKLAELRGVTLRTRGGKSARARIEGAETRWTGSLALDAAARVNWAVRDSVDFRMEITRTPTTPTKIRATKKRERNPDRESKYGIVRNANLQNRRDRRDRRNRSDGTDRIWIEGRHAKLPLWKGRDSLEIDVSEAAPYLRALKLRDLDSTLPDVVGIRLRASALLRDSLEFALRFAASTGAHRVSPDFALSPQTVTLNAVWLRDHGSLEFASKGKQGEDVRLEANGRWLVKPWNRKAMRTAPLWEQTALSLKGHARGLKVRVHDTLRTADARIEKANWNGRNLELAVVTGDSSRIEASGSPGTVRTGKALKGGRRGSNARIAGKAHGTFRVHLSRDERWVKVFLGETISFKTLEARGEYAHDRLTATAFAQGVTAYGFKLDSIRSFHELGAEGYTVKPSKLYADSTQRTLWMLSGTIAPAGNGRPGTNLAFALENEKRGKLTYALKADGTMSATATAFEATALPYPLLDTLPLRETVLDGYFEWNPDRKSGRTDLRARGVFRKEKLDARVIGSWDARRMNVTRASLAFRKSEIQARATLRLDGKQFYELASLKPNQYERVTVETPGFNIAEALRIFQTDPALLRGSVKGDLTYSATNGSTGPKGFGGALVFDDLTPTEAPGDVILKSLRLSGLGDTLLIDGRTESATVPLFNASMRMAVTGALSDSQYVRAEIVASKLQVTLNAVTRRFQTLRGSLQIGGSFPLPEESGSLEGLKADLVFNVPFPDPMTRATLTTRVFEGTYVLPGLTRQHFSLDPSLRDGFFRVARLEVKNDQGQSLTGNLEYALRTQNIKAHLEGDRFVAQWGDDYKADLHGLSADITRDAAALRLVGAFSRGTFLFADAPLRATGTLTNVNWGYTLPARSKLSRDRREENPPVLRFSGNLSESLVRYRLKSLGDIQRLFSKETRRGGRNSLRLNLRVQTTGSNNRIDSDILRLTWVGNLSVKGVHPYTLFEGRVNSIDGGFGLERQAYDVARLEIKWLNTPVENGLLNFEARKNLASTCRPAEGTATDSCVVITRLGGTLEKMQFSYDSDCGGAFGAGASVAAILYSVQRGCYDPAFAAGDGRGYGEKALTLLEPTLNRYLSSKAGRFSGAWIENLEITGLGALSSEQTGDSLEQPLSLGLTSREYLRVRLKIRSGYHTASQDLSNPWEHMLALEWRPPMRLVVRDTSWVRRLDDHLRAVASLRTLPVRANATEEDEVEKKIGLNYSYPFWGEWWSKKRK
jgi:hypothetical protein